MHACWAPVLLGLVPEWSGLTHVASRELGGGIIPEGEGRMTMLADRNKRGLVT